MEPRLDDAPVRTSEGLGNPAFVLPHSVALRSLADIGSAVVPMSGAQTGKTLPVSASLSPGNHHRVRAGCSVPFRFVALSSFAPPCPALLSCSLFDRCPRPQFPCPLILLFQAYALVLRRLSSPPLAIIQGFTQGLAVVAVPQRLRPDLRRLPRASPALQPCCQLKNGNMRILRRRGG